jgi:hypothetical protein
MADATTPPGGRKTLTLVLLAVVILLIIYLAYRCSKSRVTPPTVEPTPVVAEATATVVATERPAATPTPVPAAACVPPSPTPPPDCKESIVTIGPDAATVVPEYVCIGATNGVRWRSWDNMSRLTIYFPTSGFPEGLNKNVAPFPDMSRRTANGKDDWVFNHPDKATTYSGKPNAIGSAGQKYCFKYDQELNDVRKDGRIIIQR